eukprot:TRINITY_DN2617_c0_g4_i1.p1 TRINITY_DN2617_c0_g4~~TRINITY_DN2617_c0_g4_i1.p1  ORF type:complete len:106 (+),score=5.49 TRINITY_DN2617_c0_g4_i1:790-1107(+)
MKRLSDDLTVSPQLPLDAIDEIAKAGYKTIICNRPDNEDPGQPSFAEIAAKAEAAGIKAISSIASSGNCGDTVRSSLRRFIFLFRYVLPMAYRNLPVKTDMRRTP